MDTGFTTRTIDLDKISGRLPNDLRLPASYLTFLVAARVIRALTAHAIKEELLFKGTSISILLFGTLAAAGAITWCIQTYVFKSRRRIPSTKWPNVSFYSLLYALQLLLWMIGLSLLSTMRTLMITDYADIWFVILASWQLRSHGGGSSRVLQERGMQFLGAGIAACFLFDMFYLPSHPTIPPSRSIQTDPVIEKAVSPPSPLYVMCGYACLFLSIWVSTLGKRMQKTLAMEVGGGRVLLSFVLPLAAAFVSPLAFVQYLLSPSSVIPPLSSSLLYFPLFGAGLVVLEFYAHYTISSRSITLNTISIGWPSSFFGAFVLGLAFYPTQISIMDLVLGGLVFAGVYHLIKSDPNLSVDALDVFEGGFGGNALPVHGGSVMEKEAHAYGSTLFWSNLGLYLSAILESQDSRQIFYFLLLNLSYMFVQMAYGIWTNSLGLISDAIHMFFDCLALAVGLFASVMAKWRPNQKYSYGYNRIETLSGFGNGIFLVLISFSIVFEAIQRIIHPPEMNTNRLLLVSFVGLVVNLIGILAFNHGHAHGHDHGHDHSHSHGNGHSHGHSHGHNANMEGVFLHILADTLGSVGVIISTLLIQWFGWTGFDPLASIFIAVLIFFSVLPLIHQSAQVLLLFLSDQQVDMIDATLKEMCQSVEGVLSYTVPRFWPNDDKTLIGSIHVQIVQDIPHGVVHKQVVHWLTTHIEGLAEVEVQLERPGFQCYCTQDAPGHNSLFKADPFINGHGEMVNFAKDA